MRVFLPVHHPALEADRPLFPPPPRELRREVGAAAAEDEAVGGDGEVTLAAEGEVGVVRVLQESAYVENPKWLFGLFVTIF